MENAAGSRHVGVQFGLPIHFAPDASAEEITQELEAAVRALHPS